MLLLRLRVIIYNPFWWVWPTFRLVKQPYSRHVYVCITDNITTVLSDLNAPAYTLGFVAAALNSRRKKKESQSDALWVVYTVRNFRPFLKHRTNRYGPRRIPQEESSVLISCLDNLLENGLIVVFETIIGIYPDFLTLIDSTGFIYWSIADG